ncbi:MAG: hypothetical protein LBS74_04140 [Oscillospiraceae bacterium]|jgi:hypothetical protein|nr:hypothetical protein [Oscillospiraceae bacterium]
MKKVLIFILAICLAFALASCVAKVDDTQTTQNTLVEGNTLTVSSQKPIEVTTTPKRTATEILADLVLEDGKGVLRPEMSREEVMSILDKYGISYTEDNRFKGFDILDIEDGAHYEKNDSVSGFTILQTKKGLKVGDPVSKVYELYEGAKDVYEDVESYFGRFKFNYGYEKGVGTHTLIIVTTDDYKSVKSISIGVWK